MKMANWSGVADGVVPVLDMWREGSLIMDEVDVLLHPLKSELNYPMDDKNLIDLAPLRWEMPFHLLDCIFEEQHHSAREPADSWADAERLMGYHQQEYWVIKDAEDEQDYDQYMQVHCHARP